MSNKYFDGIVKSTGATGDADQTAIDADLKAVVTGTRDKVAKKMEGLRVADAITEVFALFRRCNKYIDETTPWCLQRTRHSRIVLLRCFTTSQSLSQSEQAASFIPA